MPIPAELEDETGPGENDDDSLLHYPYKYRVFLKKRSPPPLFLGREGVDKLLRNQRGLQGVYIILFI